MRFIRLAVALVLTAASAGAITTLTSLGAATATHAQVRIGPGFQIPNPYRDSIIGGFRADDGTVLYCLEWGKEAPTGPNDTFSGQGSTSSYADWSHLELARVNYLITKWGQTANNEQAAAVAMAIWMRHPGTREPFFSEHRFVKATIPDGAQRARIADWAKRMNAEADSFTPTSRGAVGQIEIVRDEHDHLAGTLRVTGVPAGTIGTIMLDGAVFTETTEPSIAGVHGDESFAFTVQPSDEQLAEVEVTATATFTTPGGPGDELIIWHSGDAFQDLGTNTAVVPDFVFTLTDAEVVDLTFAPTLTTVAAAEQVMVGAQLADTIDVDLAETSLPWRTLSDGSFHRVDAWCQAYGPFDEQPELSSEVPVGAPEHGEEVLVAVGGGTSDPTETIVTATVEQPVTEPGYYTFVCGIDAARQVHAEAAEALPTSYAFAHEFGVAAETTFAAAPLANTGFSKRAAMVGAAITFGVGATFTALGISSALQRRRHRARR